MEIQTSETFVFCETDSKMYDIFSEDIVICESDKKYYLNTDSSLVEIDGLYYLESDENIVECETDGAYYLRTDSNLALCKTDNLYYLISDSDICKIDGDYYRTDDDEICYNESIGDYDFRDNCCFCENCSDYFTDSDIFFVGDYGYCGHCLDRLFWQCDRCEEYIDRDSPSIHIEDRDINVCENCLDNYSYCEECDSYNYHACDCNRVISSYHSKPHLTFHRLKTESRHIAFLGIELETECKNLDNSEMQQVAQKVIDNSNDFFYCESDGSLDNGFEIISHPFSIQYYKKNKNTFTSLLSTLRNKGCRSFESGHCGLHIHVSKHNFSSLDIYKMLRFFNNNENFIDVISQRNGKNLTYCKKQNNDKEFVGISKAKYTSDRYVQINLTNNNTIEFRIFRGTLYQESFLKSIEFIIAFIQFIKVCSIKDLTSQAFKNYISLKPKTYKNLISFINKKGI